MNALNCFLTIATLSAAWNSPAAEYLPGVDPATAPPTPPPIVVAPDQAASSQRLQSASTTWSIGDPTPEEQLYLEMINRARANPVAESLLFINTTDSAILSAYTTYGVDLTLMAAEFAALAVAQPLAMNSRLTVAARRQTQDMFDNVFQAHVGSDGSDPGDRVDDAGYNWSTYGENIYARARSVFHGHAGFEVDWGPGTGGMQAGRGHRVSIHNTSFREVGVGVLLGSNTRAGADPVGPQLVTQVFGTEQGSTPFITGVVYYDLNGNNFYDVGEGVGGVTVQASGTTRTGLSARSGGYALPVAGNGTYTVTFSGAGFTPQNRTVTIASSQNAKVDFIPVYTEPAVVGSATPALGRANNYTFAAVPGAAEHQFRSFRKITPQPEGAENGTAQISIDQSAGYDVIQSSVKNSGSFAFHFAHPAPPKSQSLTFNPTYLVGANASIQFRSRLGWSADDEYAQVQVSDDEGVSWDVLYSQAGLNGAGEADFTTRTVNLSAYEGKTVRVRFVYEWQSGSYFPQTDADVGWVIDDIQFSGLSQIADVQTATAGSGTFQFQPAVLGEHGLQVRALTGHEYLPWGPIYTVQAVEATNDPEFRVASVDKVGSDLHLQLEVTAGSVLSTDLTVQAKDTLSGNWGAAQATIQANLLVVIPNTGSPTRFFRVIKN